MYDTRLATCVFESTSPQTGMYGTFGFADSPRPWSMMCLSCATVRLFPAVVSAGTAGSTQPRPCRPWHCAQANWTNVCAPAATAGETWVVGGPVVAGPAPWTVTVFV